MAYEITAAEYLEIDGVPLATPAWTTTDMDDLWSTPAVRGADLVIPGATGVRPFRRRWTVTDASIELTVVGDRDWEGGSYPNTAVGLALNVEHLQALAEPTGTTAGTRTAVLHFPPGGPADRSGPVHVERVRAKRTGPLAVVSIQLSIPGGALA